MSFPDILIVSATFYWKFTTCPETNNKRNQIGSLAGRDSTRKLNELRRRSFLKMIKKCRAGRKAAPQRIRNLRQNFQTKELIEHVKHRDLILQLAHTSFSLFERACSLAYIVPFRRNTTSGKLEMLPPRALCLHYLALVIFGFNLVHKAAAAVQQAVYHQLLELDTMFSVGLFIAYFTGFAILLGPILKAAETVEVLNALERPLKEMGKYTGRKVSQYSDISSSLRVICFAILGFVFTFGASIINLISPDLPSFIAPFLMNHGLLPNGPMLSIFWRILFFPVEYIILAVPVSITTYTINMGHLVIGVFKTYWAELGTIPIENVQSRKVVEMLYVELQILNVVGNQIIHHMLPCAMLACGSAIVTCLFIFLKHYDQSTIAMLVSTSSGCVGITCLLVMIWMAYDTLVVLRMSEQVLAKLKFKADPFLREMTELDRLGFLKRALAFRPLLVSVGQFTNFNLGVTVALCEEIINQLLMLLAY